MQILRRIVTILSGPLIIMSLLVGALALFQNRLLYFPAQVALENYVPDGLKIWPETAALLDSVNTSESVQQAIEGKNTVLGLIGTPDNDADITGTAIVFHGNAGHAGHRSYYAQQLTMLGIRVILAEYPGYGPRPGRPSEDALIKDGVNIVNQAYEQYGQPIWLIGESLGAGVAAGVVRQVPSLVMGILLITPWNRLVDVAAFHYPFLPVRWLLRSDYDSIAALNEFGGAKLVIIAEEDTIVPARFGIDLHQQINEPKRLVRISDAGHNDWVAHVDHSFWQDAMGWLQATR